MHKVAKEKPGRLTSAKLQEMANEVGDHGFDRTWKKHEIPPVARSYYLSVVKHDMAASEARSLREMKTLCYALDQMAMGKYAQASDI